MGIDVDDYNKIRTRERLQLATELLLDNPSAFQTQARIRIAKTIETLIWELDNELDPKVIDEA